MNFGTWKTSTANCQNRITARCTIRMIVKDRADFPVSPSTVCSFLVQSNQFVIASEAKQSIHPLVAPWIASSRRSSQ